MGAGLAIGKPRQQERWPTPARPGPALRCASWMRAPRQCPHSAPYSVLCLLAGGPTNCPCCCDGPAARRLSWVTPVQPLFERRPGRPGRQRPGVITGWSKSRGKQSGEGTEEDPGPAWPRPGRAGAASALAPGGATACCLGRPDPPRGAAPPRHARRQCAAGIAHVLTAAPQPCRCRRRGRGPSLSGEGGGCRHWPPRGSVLSAMPGHGRATAGLLVACAGVISSPGPARAFVAAVCNGAT